jgi:uroporphyrin-III C-methyltransferase/precorrin-2 dehydrogenase/sirohydrochlorin ferrochelatase
VDYFPLFMDLHQQRCLVVGGGEVAARKTALLLRAGALVQVVAPTLARGMQALLGDGSLQHQARVYAASDLDDIALVIAATDDRAVNAEVSSAARARHLPVNVVDDPALCSFIVPAFIERSSVIVAIGTGGSAPVLARLLRGRIEAVLPQRYGDLAELCANLRSEVQARLPDVNLRRRFWEETLEGDPAELVFRGELAAAETAVREALDQHAHSSAALGRRGEAYLIGVGPNDPELVSFRALRFLQRAELVLFANEVSEPIVALSRRDALRIGFEQPLSAADGVMQRMAAGVNAGQRVCVLALGDAFREPQGRDFAERALALGVPCQVVPGITLT